MIKNRYVTAAAIASICIVGLASVQASALSGNGNVSAQTTIANGSATTTINITGNINSTLVDLTVAQIKDSIAKIEQLKAAKAQLIAEAQAKLEAAKTKALEAQAKAELKAAAIEQKRLETQVQVEQKRLEWKQSAEATIAVQKAATIKVLTADKKELCQEGADKINQIITDTAAKRKAAFDQITEKLTKVEAFYQQRGLISEEYEAILASVQVARDAANAAVNRVEQMVKFDCNVDPHTLIAKFKANRSESLDALKVYLESVKELTIEVKVTASVDVKVNG